MQIIFQSLAGIGTLALTGFVYRIVYLSRQVITCNAAMMAAMIGGSMTGLIAGTLLAPLAGFSMSSLLALTAGIGAGALIGLPFGVMAILDGMLAGVMGGLMGAMMGDMLERPYVTTLALTFVALYGVCAVLLGKAARQENGRENAPLPEAGHVRKRAFMTAYVTVIVFAVMLAFSFYEGTKTQPAAETPDGLHHLHHE